MTIKSVNPANGQTLEEFAPLDDDGLDSLLDEVTAAKTRWQRLTAEERAARLADVAVTLKRRVDDYARIISCEMGKPISEARAEVAKCGLVCEYYAEHGPRFLADEEYPSDAARSYVAWQPLGTLLAIMPWNFPFWQVFRCAAPALLAGNSIVLKHAANVPRCGLAIQDVFSEAGLPDDVFRTALITGERAGKLLDDGRIAAVSLTGSTGAGRSVAACAGRNIKKSVLELGGSDAFVVLPDADLEAAAETGVKSRYQNTGQSCIAAKRFIVCEAVADEFVDRFTRAAEKRTMGDPLDDATQLGPLARDDLRKSLHKQVRESVKRGARVVTGGEPAGGSGFYYPASVLDNVAPGMPAYQEETFGPVAAVIRAPDADAAIDIANDSDYGLGSSIWSRDVERAEHYARRIRAGSVFVNGLVKSDPRLPFGGVKESGYGRELADLGIREFVNAKAVWVG